MAHHTSDSTPIYVGASIIGRVRSGTFFKELRGKKHFLADPRAIAFSEQSLEDAERAGAHELEITDIETGLVYSCSLAHFKAHCFSVQRGFEPQKAMRLESWNTRHSRRRRRSAPSNAPIAPEPRAPEPKPDATQLNLFR